MGMESFKTSDGWMWRFCNHHGIGNKVEHGEFYCANISAVEPFRLKFNRLMRKEDLHLGQLYNADETTLFWRSLPKQTKALKNEEKIPGWKIGKEKFPALLGANALGTHCLQPVIVGKATNPHALVDCMHELPVVCCSTINA